MVSSPHPDREVPIKKKFINRYRPWLAVLALLFVVAGGVWGQIAPAPDSVARASSVRIGLVYNNQQAADLAAGQDPLANYRKAITGNGGRVIELLVPDDEEITNRKAKNLDGLLLPGGVDVDPSLYGEPPDRHLETVDQPLDSLEYFLLDFSRRERLPVLGICRGHQILNVFLGGTLFQDIPTMVTDPVRETHRSKVDGVTNPWRHLIRIATDSSLFAAMGSTSAEVNTFHHQSVKAIGKGLRPTSWAGDGVVESLEGLDDWFVRGVQFHPEKDLERDPRLNRIFKEFLEAASARREQCLRAQSNHGGDDDQEK